ncbi:MAG TPA: glycosyltransferase family 2 protein [Steroidobacteraceae bacterium]|jgi:glycosyltransferase involved in cell wall biosynthesis|nr:glycosyltransferase family 2 protein [Steroidobacteraceae bacterium]
MTPEIAVLIPCFNEQETISAVVSAFRTHIPDATAFVYDNASTDLTIERARNAGAIVRSEPLRGKGCVVRRMFADIEADIYVLVDGDDTYDAASAQKLIAALVRDSLDLVSAVRVDSTRKTYRTGHRFGNWLLTRLVAQLFGKRFSDMLSGYRVMSRRFVKSFPALSTGFEIETELTVHALQMRIPIAEIGTPYRERPPGSSSKLRTISDGARIMRTIAYLLKEERPLAFFGALSASLALLSFAVGVPVIVEFLRTGLVPRLPTAVLATGLMMLASLSLVCGLILHTVTRGRIEMKRLYYLSIPIRFRREQ